MSVPHEEDQPSIRFEQLTESTADSPTLIEGLPGLGMVASIAVEQVTSQLGLEHHGNVISDDFPPVAAFSGGRVREAVRVYLGEDPALMTLQSDVPIPPWAVRSLSHAILTDLAPELDRAVFLAGAPAESEAARGDVVAVSTTDALERDAAAAGIELAEGPGVIGGVTGALLRDCYHADIPAIVLIVKAHPFIPDPGAAHDVIEEALEPLVAFDVDTQGLLDQADQIQDQLQQIAAQLEQYQEQEPHARGMYQ